jgi:hypothetical protein
MDLERRRVRLAGWILGRHMRPATDARGPCSVSNAARPTHFEEVKCEQPNHTESDNQHREGYRIAWDSGVRVAEIVRAKRPHRAVSQPAPRLGGVSREDGTRVPGPSEPDNTAERTCM